MPDLDTARWLSIIANLAGRGVKRVQFTGGEPFLRKDLFELVDCASEALPDADIGIFTNGSHLTEETVLACMGRDVDLATSFQGFRTFSKMTGTAMSYREQLRVFIRAAELGWPMSASLVITRANAEEAHDMLYAVVASGAAAVVVSPMMFEGRARLHPELVLSAAQWEGVKERCMRVPCGDTPIAFGEELSCRCNSRLGTVTQIPTPCRAGLDFGVIGPDGRYRKCLHLIANQAFF